MSYILEALKKAQAERQLGDTPTIHAPVPDAPAAPATPLRKPLVAVMAVMGFVIAGLAAVVWRQAAAPVQPVPAAQPAAPVMTAPVPATVASTPAPAVPVAPAPAPAASLPAPAAAAPQPPPVVAARPQEPARRVEAPVAIPPAGTARADEPAREESVQALRDLPEPIRRAIPPVVMSGYMYSSNPADRLILIDKVLRREGDEVAPGLVLERLEPKGAVFGFRGYHYRMPY